MSEIRTVVVIPARYGSSRFPGKVLAELAGKPMIQHVYERASASKADLCLIATDDQRVVDACAKFGAEAIMTDPALPSGSDRIAAALKGRQADIVINVQGDEPFISPKQIETLIRCFENNDIDIATLVKPFSAKDSIETLENPNSPKVVLNGANEAIYFSRSVVPFLRGVERGEWLKHHTFYKHIGIYAFRSKTLSEVTRLPQSPLEHAESLEQLRWLENGYKIGVGVTDIETIGTDTPEDLQKAEEFIQSV